MQHILIIGAGATGSVLAGWLSENKDNHVTLLGKKEPADFIRKHGITVEPSPGLATVRRVYSDIEMTEKVPPLHPKTVVLVATKATQLTEALKPLSNRIRPDTVIIPLQNGIGIGSLARETLGSCNLVRGLLYIASVYLNPGIVQHNGGRKIQVEESSFSHRLMTMTEGTPLIIEEVRDIYNAVFFKTALNCVINPLSALYRIRVGQLLRPEYRKEIEAIINEIESVSVAEKLNFPGGLLENLDKAIRMISNSYSSMYQDIAHGQPTEIESINGAMLALGKKHGIIMPRNRDIIERINLLEKVPRGASI